MKYFSVYRKKDFFLYKKNILKIFNLTNSDLIEKIAKNILLNINHRYPFIKKVAIFCGSSFNATYGYMLAKFAYESGYSVVIYQCNLFKPISLLIQKLMLNKFRINFIYKTIDDCIDSNIDLIIDALIGIDNSDKDFSINIKKMSNIINKINNSLLPVISLDIPSGIDVDTGCIFQCGAIKSTLTITFLAIKLGLLILDGPDYCGKIICISFQSNYIYSDVKPTVYLLNNYLYKDIIFLKRKKNSHKGLFGRVLIIGGNYGMPGSVYLSAKAALRVGAGSVIVFTRSEYVNQFSFNLPEVMVYSFKDILQFIKLMKKSTVCVIGPGLTEDTWTRFLFSKVLLSNIATVVDASALQVLSKFKNCYKNNWILTPHVGEAASLLSCTVKEIQSDRYKALKRIKDKYGGAIILKGYDTLIYTDKEDIPYLCCEGNPGMASSGMGDVLSGVLGGLLSQGLSIRDSVILGVWIHGISGSQAAFINGERGLLASDLMFWLQKNINLFNR
ncbi:NAD(P)H-hydrate dehydratase [Candidatus Legionella polyplacis]|uniref:NAD(P)H-hydrate dehydratase n=1 Tax=Candidatus Legionella polyplacis TaxID=2005262 RepID=UPI000C1EC0B7|nr:NAD(P)H-hydrate dehydratase [Candidatus Legionella polyplacis]ATW01980.1 NAD(P)H-hydrate dehydratase [Candidatus Legionella polyplacis]